MALEVTANCGGPIPLDVAFRADPGELLALVGHSGSGKTTVLRTIAGLWQPETARVTVAGQVWLDTATGTNLAPYRRRVGFVTQFYALFPHMTVAQNVTAAIDHLSGSERKAEAERLLQLVNLNGLSGRRPAQLSGGQQQRVALARALARRPDVLLLDEPFSAVDRATRDRLHAEITALRHHLPMPIVLVSHDVNEAQMLADRMVVIEHGRMLAQGSTAAVMADAEALRGMGLREIAALLQARITEHADDGMTRLETAAGPLWLPQVDGAPGTRLRVRIMAHDVILSRHRPEGLSAQNILPATVIETRPGDGPGAIVRLSVGDGELLARITRRATAALGLEPGDPVHVILKAMSIARDHIAAEP